MRDGSFEYEKTEDGVILTEFVPETDPSGSLTLPARLGGQPVREIGTNAFSSHGSEITSLTVPEGVRRIDGGAFTWMLMLEQLNLPESLVSLEEGFSAGTSLAGLRIPRGVRRIGGVGSLPFCLRFEPGNPVWSTDGFGIFRKSPEGLILAATNPESRAVRYRVPDGVTCIEEDAFSGREFLEELVLPASLQDIREGALSNIANMYSDRKGIRSVTFPDGNRLFHAEEDYLSRGDVLLRWFGENRCVQVPDGISTIAAECFYRCAAQEILLPPSVRTIHQRALVLCQAERVYIGADGLNIMFPDGGTYLQDKLMEAFGQNGKRYDFTFYDRSLLTGLLDPVKARMLLSRLSMQSDAAAGLDEKTAEKMRSALSARLPDLFATAAVSGDFDTVRLLADWDGMTESDFEDAIRIMQEHGRTEMMTCLLRRKLESIGGDGFDFSL